MKKILLLFTCYVAANVSFAQSDKNFTQYMTDQISFNPAATGYKGYCATVINRHQWLGLGDGRPSTILFNAQANLQKIGSGIGLSFMADKIGFQRENDLKINFAKHFKIVNVAVFSMGIGVGIQNIGYKPEWVGPETGTDDSQDPNLPGEDGQSAFDMNAGLFWRGTSTPYYIGLSTTHITEPELDVVNFKKSRHYYATGGMDIDYNMLSVANGLTFKPSFIVYSDLVATTMDLTLIGNYEVRPQLDIYAGISYRRQDAIAVLFGGTLKNGDPNKNLGILGGDPDKISLGLAYDITTSSINTSSNGSFEFWLNYCVFSPDPTAARYGNPFILQ